MMPSLAAWSVRRWQFTLILFALLVVMGLNALTSIPRSEDPHFPVPVFIVRVIMPGADASDIETLVVDPIEDVLDDIDDIGEVSSTSSDSVGVIVAEFEWDVDVERKFDQVNREVNAVRDLLPEAIREIEIERVRTTRAAVAQVALVSDTASWREFEDIADTLRDSLERAQGVFKAEFWGVPDLEIRVALDLGRLSEIGISPAQVSDILRAEGADVPSGSVHVGGRRFNVSATGSYDTLEEIGDVLVAEMGGNTVRIRDIATVSWEPDEADHLTRADGKRAVFVTANQKDGTDVFQVRDAVWEVLDDFEGTLPDHIQLVRYFDQSISVADRLSRLTRDFMIAIGLVLITLLPLGFRASLVVMISIPLSLAMGIVALYYTGFSLNQLSITGAILALGLLVDDTIVVTENIERHLRMGVRRRDAAIEGTNQITPAVIGATGVLIFAFLPLFFLPEGGGGFVRSLPATVLFTITASLFVALTIIPFLASRMLPRTEHPQGNMVLRVLMGGIQAFYRPLLHLALMVPRLTLLLATGLFLLSLSLIPILGLSFFPPSGSSQFLVRIETPEGTALAKTDEALRKVESVLAADHEVAWYMSNLGHGNPQIYYNEIPGETSSSYAEVFASLHEWELKEGPETIDRLRAEFAKISGAQITVRIFENGPPVEAPIEIRITGKEIPVLKSLAKEIEGILEATPGTRDVSNPIRIDRTDIDLNIDTAKAGILGIPAGAIDRNLRLALEGEETARFHDVDGDDYPVVVRMPLELRHEFDILDQIYVPSATGEGVPLRLVADPVFEGNPNVISRYNRQRTVSVTAYLETGQVLSKVGGAAEERLAQLELPPGYEISTGGTTETLNASLASLMSAALISVFGIMLVLILEFRSFSATAIVAGVIPLGLIGGLVALFVTGYSLSFTAIVGFIALIGIEIKNSILLVDFTNQLRREGAPLREAIEKAGEVRFLPVLLTSATAIGGLLPLALEGSGLFSPLAWIIIGGLISSTFLSRLVTPVMYYLLAPREIGA